MSIDLIKLGSTFTANVSFKNSDGTPFVALTPATYQIIDFNGNNVVSGTAQQDSIDADQWSATITLPESAPYSSIDKYQIIWTIYGDNKQARQNEYFNVDSPGDIPIDYDENGGVCLEGGAVNDSIVIPNNGTLTAYTVTVLDENGVQLWTETNSNPTGLDVDDNNVYSINSGPLINLVARFRPYIIKWDFTVNGKVRSEFHFQYVVNLKTLLLVEQLRNFIDKIRFNHPNIRLRYTDVDLVGYLMQGIQIVNYTRPQFTSYRITSMPHEMEFFLINAAAYVGLSAQYLAEGVSAFELSGQAVSLTIDRSQFIDGALARVVDVLQNQLPVAKKMIALESVAGTLTLSPSPSLNPAFYSGNKTYDMGFPGDFYVRDLLYQSILMRWSDFGGALI